MSKPSDKQILPTQAIVANEERFRALVAATSDVVYSMNPDWTVMQQLDGRGFIQDNFEPISEWKIKNIPEEEHQKITDRINESIREKKIFEMEHKVWRIDRTIGWTFSRAVPILDDKGDITEWFGTATDITHKKEAEFALQEAREQLEQQKRLYETITSNTPDLMYVWDLNYIFTYANSALLTMWGKTWDEAVGKKLIDNGYEPWHAAMHEREIDSIIATKKPVRGEVSFPHAVLGKRVYDYILVPVLNEQGEVEAVAGTTRDVTERYQDEQRKNDFIGMVSHELKTPLTSLSAILQVADAKLKDSEDNFLASAMKKANTQVKRMSSMINGFLNVSRLESGKIIMEKSWFDIEELIHEVIEETKLSSLGHYFNLTQCPSQKIYADRDKINSVLSNLISNAVKYSPKDTSVQIACSLNDKEIIVSISDEGVGIKPDDAAKIFDRYYRVESSNTHHISGFGIGLYLSAEIVQRHNGRIWVESEPGEGSTFYFSLPIGK
jgi:PAS domain S-box-containing protein